MINDDTIKLLKECNAGIKMGVSAIDGVLSDVRDKRFEEVLSKSKEQQQKLGSELHELLNEYHDSGKEPNLMAKGMSWMKTNVMISMNDSDNTIADLITDGCNMGVKSLNRYLNKYKAADEKSKNITKRIIDAEQRLMLDIREYL